MTERATVHVITGKATELAVIGGAFDHRAQYQGLDLAQHAF